MLCLPETVTACLFDLDGVLTPTAEVHAAAWKQAFDGYLHERAARGDDEFVAFDAVGDYDEYVDGKPRSDGVRSFLNARGIDLPDGDPGDPVEPELPIRPPCRTRLFCRQNGRTQAIRTIPL
jgi:beta-phosphoglucomutase-like phosphatase (HAD superfamily)